MEDEEKKVGSTVRFYLEGHSAYSSGLPLDGPWKVDKEYLVDCLKAELKQDCKPVYIELRMGSDWVDVYYERKEDAPGIKIDKKRQGIYDYFKVDPATRRQMHIDKLRKSGLLQAAEKIFNSSTMEENKDLRTAQELDENVSKISKETYDLLQAYIASGRKGTAEYNPANPSEPVQLNMKFWLEGFKGEAIGPISIAKDGFLISMRKLLENGVPVVGIDTANAFDDSVNYIQIWIEGVRVGDTEQPLGIPHVNMNYD